MTVTTNAPLSELKLAVALRRFERLKLALLILIFLVVTTSSGYLIGIAQTNQRTLDKSTETLTILRCAIASDPAATDAERRAAFDTCVRKASQ